MASWNAPSPGSTTASASGADSASLRMALQRATLSASEPGKIEIRLPYRDDLTQQKGFVHGGIIGMIADSAAGYAAYSLISDVNQSGMVTTNLVPYILLGIALLIALGFEFVNGFHDTANAIATCVSTRAMSVRGAIIQPNGALPPRCRPLVARCSTASLVRCEMIAASISAQPAESRVASRSLHGRLYCRLGRLCAARPWIVPPGIARHALSLSR